MRVSSADERQSVNLQRDALTAAGVDERHLHQDRCLRRSRRSTGTEGLFAGPAVRRRVGGVEARPPRLLPVTPHPNRL